MTNPLLRCARLGALLATVLGCATPPRVNIRPDKFLEGPDITFLRYGSSQVDRFTDPHGRRCRRFAGTVKNNIIGWESSDDNYSACTHDTLDEGIAPATLELRFTAVIPADGDYDLLSNGYGLGAWGSVVSRGSHFGEYVAKAHVEIDAGAPGCKGNWSLELAKAKVSGSWHVVSPFSGWITLPEIRLARCKAQQSLEVKVRLVGEVNRGKVDVDWFGFSAVSDDDLNRIFALRAVGALEHRTGYRTEH